MSLKIIKEKYIDESFYFIFKYNTIILKNKIKTDSIM